MLNHLLQRNNHGITCGNLLRAGVKLPCAVLVIMRNMQNRLTKSDDLCGREDCNVLRVCERPLVFGALDFHKARMSANAEVSDGEPPVTFDFALDANGSCPFAAPSWLMNR